MEQLVAAHIGGGSAQGGTRVGMTRPQGDERRGPSNSGQVTSGAERGVSQGVGVSSRDGTKHKRVEPVVFLERSGSVYRGNIPYSGMALVIGPIMGRGSMATTAIAH
jgi:hypothetical protein